MLRRRGGKKVGEGRRGLSGVGGVECSGLLGGVRALPGETSFPR